ncbi:MAG: hypothetical protein E6R03_07000 [Hyphomicrobiaceae bacterium]|nr:MAG: hypothetical protein E6R03_07000 [Hyphomicrobiaceae bacterium]
MFMFFRMLMEGQFEQEKRRVDWATACSLAGVAFSKFRASWQFDREPGGVRERVENLNFEALELVRGGVLAKAIHKQDLGAARILMGNGTSVQVNVDTGNKSQVLVGQDRKRQQLLSQVPEQEQLDFVSRHADVLDAEISEEK